MTDVQETLGYQFSQPSLLEEALTHRSHLQGTRDIDQRDNERLEFLGDSVLALVISEYVASAFPTSKEGELSKTKAHLVSRLSLAKAARRLSLGQFLLLGRGEEVTQGRDKSSLLANALEAVIAAIYLDGGLDPARTFILRALRTELNELSMATVETIAQDYKSRLQERTQKHHDTVPHYRIVRESGPDHQKCFEIEVIVNGMIRGIGLGQNKKEAEQRAAQQAWENEL